MKKTSESMQVSRCLCGRYFVEICASATSNSPPLPPSLPPFFSLHRSLTLTSCPIRREIVGWCGANTVNEAIGKMALILSQNVWGIIVDVLYH